MNDLYIKIKNGLPVDHPLTESNLRLVDSNFDESLANGAYIKFERSIFTEAIGVYEVCESFYYIDNDVVKEKFVVRPMTIDEKTKKQSIEKERWSVNGYPSWIFDENFCVFKPPVEYPNDGKKYVWDENTTLWVEVANGN